MFMCRHLLTFARAWRFVLQWLVSHTPVCSFAIIFEKKLKRRRVNFPRHEHPKKGLAMSSGQPVCVSTSALGFRVSMRFLVSAGKPFSRVMI